MRMIPRDERITAEMAIRDKQREHAYNSKVAALLLDETKEKQKEINGKKKEKLSLYDLEDNEVEELKEKNKSKKVVNKEKINGKTFSGTPVVAGLSDALQLELESCIITNELISDELINNLPIREREIYISANYDQLKEEGRL